MHVALLQGYYYVRADAARQFASQLFTAISPCMSVEPSNVDFHST